jgi:hypothetical protein
MSQHVLTGQRRVIAKLASKLHVIGRIPEFRAKVCRCLVQAGALCELQGTVNTGFGVIIRTSRVAASMPASAIMNVVSRSGNPIVALSANKPLKRTRFLFGWKR